MCGTNILMRSERPRNADSECDCVSMDNNKRGKALKTVMKSKHNKQGHGPLSHIKVLLLD